MRRACVLSYGIMDLTVPPYGGLRTIDDQRALVAKGASQTLNSLHRVQSTGFGHAIDLVPYPVNWDDVFRFALMGSLMFRAANEIGMPLEWGGHWRTFKDYPHFQLPKGFK
jgi:peptidoglycan LD-endopeptidase CwlK